MTRLRDRLRQLPGSPPFIEISPEHDGYEPPTARERPVRRVVIDELAQALPAALVSEMTRGR
jgi:hypothetical protein